MSPFSRNEGATSRLWVNVHSKSPTQWSLGVVMEALILSRWGWMVLGSTWWSPRHNSRTSYGQKKKYLNAIICALDTLSPVRYVFTGSTINHCTTDWRELIRLLAIAKCTKIKYISAIKQIHMQTHMHTHANPGSQSQDELGPLPVTQQLWNHLCHRGDKLLQHPIMHDKSFLHNLPHSSWQKFQGGGQEP